MESLVRVVSSDMSYSDSINALEVVKESTTNFITQLNGLSNSEKRTCIYFNALLMVELAMGTIKLLLESAKNKEIATAQPGQKVEDYSEKLNAIRLNFNTMISWLRDNPVSSSPVSACPVYHA